MDNNLEKSVIIYRSEDGTIQLEVQLYNGTVWMNRQQMSTLFGRDIKTIGKHINNALNEELKGYSVVAKFATTATDGKTYQVEYYNIDVVLSVGYRVKSQRGIDYRHWACSTARPILNIDDNVYLIGGSIKDLGKKVSTFVKLSISKGEFLVKLLS